LEKMLDGFDKVPAAFEGFAGAVLCWNVAAAAAESPILDRMAAGEARRKIEENSLLDFK
jgi:hypothetical protein